MGGLGGGRVGFTSFPWFQMGLEPQVPRKDGQGPGTKVKEILEFRKSFQVLSGNKIALFCDPRYNPWG